MFSGGIEDFGFGLGTSLELPGAGAILLYEPRHPERTASESRVYPDSERAIVTQSERCSEPKPDPVFLSVTVRSRECRS